MKHATKVRIEGVCPEEYASYWGCDPVYDTAPNLPGDGYLFYNFGSEKQELSTEWLNKFLGAIDRTLQKDRTAMTETDKTGLTALRKYVVGLIPSNGRPDFYTLDDFTKGYIEAALWASNDESDPETGGEPFDKNYSHNDISTETIVEMVDVCAKFQKENADLLEAVYPKYNIKDGSSPQAYAGHDFWLTRGGHGANFLDRTELGAVARKLYNSANAYREYNLYVGDDGKIYGQ